MEQVKIDLEVNDYSLKTTGYLNNNILSFIDKDELKTNIIYDYNTDTLIRENKEITIKMFFSKKENNLEYLLKEHNYKFYHQLEKILLLKDNNKYIINYRIENTDYKLQLSYEKEQNL